MTPQLRDAHYYEHKPSSNNYPNITTNQLHAIYLTFNTNLSDLTLFVLLRDQQPRIAGIKSTIFN